MHANCSATRLTLQSPFATLTRLNDETRHHHIDADAPWLAVTRIGVRRQDYIRQLALTYGFEAPLEGALAYTPGLSEVIQLRGRARAGLIAQDLLALGLKPSQLSALPHCFSITPFSDIADALGWMYMVERSTLLHDSIRRSLVHRLPEARRASAYLGAADGATAARWPVFGAALDAFAVDEATTQRVVSAADHAFRRWLDWLELDASEHRSAG